MADLTIDPGRMTRRLIHQRPGDKTIPGGGKDRNDWETLGPPRWAAVEPLRGSEQVAAKQQKSVISHRIYMRADPERPVRGSHRFVEESDQTRVFEVDAAYPADDRPFLVVVLVSEKVS